MDFYNASSYPHTLIARYSGNTLPEPLIFDNCFRVRVAFVSDNYLNASGFKITWSASGTGIENRNIPATLYPNPASETVHLSFAQPLDKCEVSVRNIIGQTLFTQSYDEASIIEIPVNTLPDGIYLLSVSSKGESLHKKFIVQH